jgi:hypothetical protein
MRPVLSAAVAATVVAALVLPFQVAVTGALPAWLARLGPADASPMLVALVAFLLVGLTLWSLAALAAALRLRAGRR